MRITEIETFRVTPRWLFCKVSTDEGISGWGEPVVEGRAGTTEACVHELAEYLIGTDPLRIEEAWQTMTRGGFYRGGAVLASAVSGLDQALWDIAGKAYGRPVYDLLGGPVRDKIRIYGGIGDVTTEAAGDAAQALTGTGLTALKMSGWRGPLEAMESPARIDEIVARVAAVRDAVGDECDIAVDFHGRFSPALSRRILPVLEPLDLYFVEEPVVPELTAELRGLIASTPIPIATGERLYSRWDFRDVLTYGLAIAQPDLSHAGGISECRRIAAQAETYGVSLAPHCPLGPIALAACLQIDVCTPNFLIQEQSLGLYETTASELLGYLVDPAVFAYADGHLARPTGPGLGIEVDEAEVRRVAADPHRWRNPVWRHEDGSLAEW